MRELNIFLPFLSRGGSRMYLRFEKWVASAKRLRTNHLFKIPSFLSLVASLNTQEKQDCVQTFGLSLVPHDFD